MPSSRTPGTPELFGRVDTATIEQLIERAASPGFESWWARVAGSGFCAAPVHLAGHDSDGRPVRVLGRCKNRRAAVCPSCSQLYAGDTWQLVHTGITPANTATDDGAEDGTQHLDALDRLDGHPMVFATLTAPSFGAVHTTHRDAQGSARRCHPTRESRRCPHGRPTWCTASHAAEDAHLGEPLCGDCYDYLGHVLFSWHAPALWHRLTIALRRLVRRCLRDLGEQPGSVRVSYVKVVELQRRGVPHFHAVIRLDAADTPADQPARPPQTGITTDDLTVLVHRAAAAVHLDVPGPGGEAITVSFGQQADVQPVHPRTPSSATPDGDGVPGQRSGRRVAGYLAKYVTKSVAEFGLSTRRMSVRAIDRLEVSDHVRAILHTIADLARLPGRTGMIRWLHTLGYRGHITTKTRRYSTTMGALRARREAWRQTTHAPGTRKHAEIICRPQTTGWVFAGSGHATAGDRLLAVSAAARARENRDAARVALTDQNQDEWPDWPGAA